MHNIYCIFLIHLWVLSQMHPISLPSPRPRDQLCRPLTNETTLQIAAIKTCTPATATFNLLQCTVLHCTVINCIVLHYTVLVFTVLYCTVIHCIVLHHTLLGFTVLNCTAVQAVYNPFIQFVPQLELYSQLQLSLQCDPIALGIPKST